MNFTPIDIINTALAHIGERRITRIDEEAQLENGLIAFCVQFYDQARQEALAAQRWTFAQDSQVLTRRLDVTPMGQFLMVHALPTDSLRVMEVWTGGDAVNDVVPTYTHKVDNFKIMGRTIRSNYTNIGIEFIQDLLDPSEWSPHFRGACSRLLAHYLAGPVANDPSLAGRLLEQYERNDLPNAQFYDGVQDNSGENFKEGNRTRLAGSGFNNSHRA